MPLQKNIQEELSLFNEYHMDESLKDLNIYVPPYLSLTDSNQDTESDQTLHATVSEIIEDLKKDDETIKELEKEIADLKKASKEDTQKITALNEKISKLKDQFNKLQSVNTKSQNNDLEKKEVYAELKDGKIAEVNSLISQETQQQLESSQQEEVEKLNLSKNKTQSLEEQLQELERKEDPMPFEHKSSNEEVSEVSNEAIFFDISLTNPKQNSDLLKDLDRSLSFSSLSPISSFEPTPSSLSDNLGFFSNPSGDPNRSHRNSNDNLNITHTPVSSASEENLDSIGLESQEESFTESISANPSHTPIQEQQFNSSLSAPEIETNLLVLQYSDSVQEMISGLQIIYPHLISDGLDDNNFKNLRLIFRKKTLETLNKTLPEDTDIIDLDAEVWLKKKLKLFTDKSISLKLDPKLQKNLDNEFNSQFSLTPLADEAITHKSLSKLKEELKKLKALKISLAESTYKIFSGIDNNIAKYPNLIDATNIPGLLFKLKIDLIDKTGIELEINEEKIQALLFEINKQLGNDRNKWRSDNKLIEEIANEIFALDKKPFGPNKERIQILITHTLKILYDFHDLQDTLNNRKKWQADIQWLNAFRQKLDSFSQKINIRIAKLKNMQDLKQQDESAVYLPHSCSIISSSDESNLSYYNFNIKSGAFYKQNGFEIGKKLTFEQTLSNNEKHTWSVCPANDNCLAYTTHKPWKDASNNIKDRIGYETTYVKEISFAQMIHAVNSFKEGSLCTLQFGKCSSDMEKKIRLFIAAYNELRNNNGPILIANSNPDLKMEQSEIDTVKTEIKHKLNLYTHELNSANRQLSQSVAISSSPTLRSRG